MFKRAAMHPEPSPTAFTSSDCPHALCGHTYRSPAEVLRATAERAGKADRDVYGVGKSLERFEARIAFTSSLESYV